MMTQYLAEITMKVDAVLAAGSFLDLGDVILYTLNGLPPSYQAFKTAIKTNLQPISLDNLYSLLYSEEINVTKDTSLHTTPLSFQGQHGRTSHG